MKKAVMVLAVVCAAVFLAGAALAQDKPAAPDKPPAAAADAVSGDWDGSVDMPDGATPFSLTLKLEGDKVSGQVGNPQGAMPLSSGSYADGQVTFSFNYVDGAPIQMTGAVKDGQITGNLSYGGGQMVTTWSAKKHAK